MDGKPLPNEEKEQKPSQVISKPSSSLTLLAPTINLKPADLRMSMGNYSFKGNLSFLKREQRLSSGLRLHTSFRELADPRADSSMLMSSLASSHPSMSSFPETGTIYDSDINICISDTDLRLMTKTKSKCKLLKQEDTSMSLKEFQEQVKKLYKCCLKGDKDLYELHLRRLAGMEILKDIIRRADPDSINLPDIVHIIWSIMSCIHHLQLRLRNTTGIVEYSRRKDSRKCVALYSKFIRMFSERHHRIILNSIITFYKEGRLWEVEFACTDLILDLLKIFSNVEQVIEDILRTAEQATLENIAEAKYFIQVLYTLFEKVEWQQISKDLLTRFMDILNCSLAPKPTDQFNYSPLKNGIVLCLRNIIDNIKCRKDLMTLILMGLRRMAQKTLPELAIIEIGDIAAYAAQKCHFPVFHKAIPLRVLTDIFEFTSSGTPLTLILAAKIFEDLMDRNNNLQKFATPRIHFKYTDYSIKIKRCKPADKLFFKRIRHAVPEMMVNSCKNSPTRKGFEHIYQMIAICLVEIPCANTAVAAVIGAMSIQEYALQISHQNLVRSHHLHAIVMALMTLVCYVHKAEMFYNYVNKIMDRRAEYAPFLNPPLHATYKYAEHHILWNKPDLFFEDWEARFGLWKCFRKARRRRIHKK